MKTKRQKEFGQELQDSKELLRLQELAEKKMWLSSLLGSIFGGFGAYLYCQRYRNIIPGLLLSVIVGCVAAPALAEETCENTGYGTECSYVLEFAPIFLLVAIIDNANAIATAREKLKKLQDGGLLPDRTETLKLTVLKLIQEKSEVTVSELVILTGYSATVVRDALASLEKEELICIDNRQDGAIVYRLG